MESSTGVPITEEEYASRTISLTQRGIARRLRPLEEEPRIDEYSHCSELCTFTHDVKSIPSPVGQFRVALLELGERVMSWAEHLALSSYNASRMRVVVVKSGVGGPCYTVKVIVTLYIMLDDIYWTISPPHFIDMTHPSTL